MSRQLANQPMTRDTNALVIGVMRVRAEKLGVDSIDARQAPATWDSAEGTAQSRNLGALRSSSLSVSPTTKTHTSGYPQLQDLVIQEQVTATYRVEMEEVAGTKALEFIDAILTTINTGTPAYFAVESLAEFSTGSRLAFFTPYAYLRPNLTLSFGQDFNVSSFEFEALYNPQYANQDLVYRNFTANTAGRDRQYQAVTQDKNSLQIGFFQVRMGRLTPRGASVARADASVRVIKLSAATLAKGSTTAYTGCKRGKYTFTVNGTDIEVTDPYGKALSSISIASSDVTNAVVEDGLKITTTGYDVATTGDKWTIYVDGAAYIGPATQVAGTAVGAKRIWTAGTYAGTRDGSIIVRIDNATDFSVKPMVPCTAGEGVWITGLKMADYDAAPYSVSDTGVTIQFSTDTGWTDQIMVIGLNTASAVTATQTNITSPYPTTTEHDSIGAIQSTTVNAAATMKEHTSGYPAKKDLALLESTDVNVEVTMEELQISTTDVDKVEEGKAKTLFDAMLDSNISSAQYFAPVELVAELATGGTPLRFWLPNCQVVPNIEMSPGGDWAGIPFKLQALKQLGITALLTPNVIYRF